MSFTLHLSFLLLAIALCSAQKCSVCNNFGLKITNTAYTHLLQNDRLQGKRSWSCTELENAGNAGRFDSTECAAAQQIATRYCTCREQGWQPTVETTPPCTFCPGMSKNSLPYPNKFVDTLAGKLTCYELIEGGLGGYWPEKICSTFKTDSQVTNKCCPIAAAPGGGSGLVGCFSGDNTVYVEGKGALRMEDVRIGDYLRIGAGKGSRVYGFGHRDTSTVTEYLQIHAQDLDEPIEITKEHMLFVNGAGAVPASVVRVGDKLELAQGNTFVTRISHVSRRGAYAPFTETGTLLVSNVKASSFISVIKDSSALKLGGVEVASLHWLAHAFEAPHRLVCKLTPSFCASETYSAEGISHWVNFPFIASKWIVSQNAVVTSLLSVLVLVACVSCFLLEKALTVSPFLAVLLAFYARRRTKSKCA